MSTQSAARIDPYQLVTETILKRLENGVIPWRCPWRRSVGRPRNFHTGQEYQGSNALYLGLQHFSSPWWMTFRQVKERGGHVRKNEHGAMVIKWGCVEQPLEKERVHLSEAKRSGDHTLEETLIGSFMRLSWVFNADQIDGIEFPSVATGVLRVPLKQRLAHAELVLQQLDNVQMPDLERFESAEDYYLTLIHEFTHATGHEIRLSRKADIKSNGADEKECSHEELVAEMGAAFLGMEADIVREEHGKSADYQGWLEVLSVKAHRKWIVQAANQADKVADFILGKSIGNSNTEDQRGSTRTAGASTIT